MSNQFEDAMNYIHEQKPRQHELGDPRLGSPYEDFDQVYPPAPAKTIVVTDEMRAKDAADRAAREQLNPEHPWAAFKATLGKVVQRPPLRKKAAPAKKKHEPAPHLVVHVSPSLVSKEFIEKNSEALTLMASGAAKEMNAIEVKSQHGKINKDLAAVTTRFIKAHPRPLSPPGSYPKSTQQVQEAPPMSNPVCKGGCGRELSPSTIKLGSGYHYKCRQTGCAPITLKEAAPKTTPAKPAKATPKKAAAKPSKPAVATQLIPAPGPAARTLAAVHGLPANAVMLPVQESTLDHFLHALHIDDKVRIVSQYLHELHKGAAQA